MPPARLDRSFHCCLRIGLPTLLGEKGRRAVHCELRLLKSIFSGLVHQALKTRVTRFKNAARRAVVVKFMS